VLKARRILPLDSACAKHVFMSKGDK